MRHMINPEQNELFDYYQSILSPVAYNRLASGYHAVFRHVILALLPAKEIAEHFDEAMGRPTKELYSMAGLVLLKEFHNWTTAEAVDAYLFDARIQYALNIGRDNVSFCERTLERYMKLIRENDLAAEIFERVTTHLVEALDLEVDKQRLDSTHVFSDMATFSRTKLMGVTIKRFLVQLKRHHVDLYEQLPEDLRTRYEKGQNTLFADVSKDKEKRSCLRQEVAEQMHELIQRFSGHAEIENMATFKQLLAVFEQQCEVIDVIGVQDDSNDTDPEAVTAGNEAAETEEPAESQVTVRKKTGGDVIQNPSDPDATYDGHKGPGYQVQLSETSNPENDIQLIVGAIPETAADTDSAATGKMLAQLEEKDILPDTLTADSAYGGDDNVLSAKEKGVDVISPVAGPIPKEVPAEPTDKQRRLQKRRELQETDEWRKEYNSRAQIEGTIGSVKRKTGMVRLRYRGKSSVYAAMLLKITGWNISRAAVSEKIRKIVREKVHTTVESPKRTRTRVDCVQTMPVGILREAA